MRKEKGNVAGSRPRSWPALGLAAVGALLLPFATNVKAQSQKDLLNAAERALQEHFVHKEVRARIDMPANEDGVDVRTWEVPSVDNKKNLERCNRHGIAVKDGGTIEIGRIKRKDKHIEFHLGAGGWSGRAPYAPQPSAKSTAEIDLELKLRSADRTTASRIRRSLASLRAQREAADEKAQITYRRAVSDFKRKKLASGSRFNIRYKQKLTPEQLKPESVKAALEHYLEFDPQAPPRRPGPISGGTSSPTPPSAPVGYDELKRHVVKITASKGDILDVGGGVIVGVDGSIVLVATALHVVDGADSMEILFLDKQYAPFGGKMFQKFHLPLDLAVVTVNTSDGASMPEIPEPLKVLSSSELREGTDVTAVGHPQDLDWQPAPNKVVRESDPEDDRKLRFSKTRVMPGYSGGGLFDTKGRLMGIVTHIDSQHGLAVKAEAMINVLDGEWKIPINHLSR